MLALGAALAALAVLLLLLLAWRRGEPALPAEGELEAAIVPLEVEATDAPGRQPLLKTSTPTASPTATATARPRATPRPTASATSMPEAEESGPTPTPEAMPIATATPTPTAHPLTAPPGYTVSTWATVPAAPTSLVFGPDGRLYVSFFGGEIRVLDPDGEQRLFAGDLEWPLGLAFRGADLYVSGRRTVSVFPGAAGRDAGGTPRALITDLPCCHILHSTNGLALGPDGRLYIAQGGMSDHGEVQAGPLENAILRANPDGSGLEVFARGLRNPYDLAFDAHGNLFAPDAGADFGPADEINHIVQGGDYGFPGHHGTAPPDSGTLSPVVELPPHTTPTGLAFAPAGWGSHGGRLFVALWQITDGTGNRVVAITLTPEGETFRGSAADFLAGPVGQPIDLTFGPDGALYVLASNGAIYRITPDG